MSILPKIDPEFKSLIPPLTADEREQLEQNILQSRKCLDAIILWEGIIIDGHNRYAICAKHGIEFEIINLPLPSREAAKLWILENQLSRRNLTDATRIELALLKVDLIREKAKKKQSRAGGDKKSPKNEGSLSAKMTKPEKEPMHVRKAIADEVGISERTFQNYMQVKEHGGPELLAQVQSGELKIGTAHKLLTKEILKQLTRADKMYKHIAEAMSPQTALQNGTDINDPSYKDNMLVAQTKLVQLYEDLLELIRKLKN